MKKYLAFALAVLVAFPVLPASAAEKEKEDINTDIYQVDMPMNTKGVFDFILDPQGLINKTDAAAYDGKKFEKDSTVFFRRKDGKAKVDYSSSSDHLSIVNKSSVPVNVSLNIKVSGAFAEKIALTDDKKFKNDTDASLYLALKDKDRERPIGKDGLDFNITINAAPDGAYGYSYDKKSEEYTYKLKKDSSDIKFDEYSFQLTGAANGKGDWTGLADAAPEIEVNWKVAPKEGAIERKDAIRKEELNPEEKAAVEAADVKTQQDTQDQADGKTQQGILDETGEKTQQGISDETDEKAQQDNPDQTDEKTQQDISEQTGEEAQQDTLDKDEEKAQEKNRTPSIKKNEYTLSAGTPVSVEVDLGSGSTAAAQVVSVRRKDTGAELLNVSDDVVYKDEKIQFSKEWVDKCLEDKDNMPGNLIVTFDDADLTEIGIALKR